MAVTTQAIMPVKAIVPDNQPIQNACDLVLPSNAQCKGTSAIQANNPRSDFGRLRGIKSPLAPARTSERAREWVMSRTISKAEEGCNFWFGGAWLFGPASWARRARSWVDGHPSIPYK